MASEDAGVARLFGKLLSCLGYTFAEASATCCPHHIEAFAVPAARDAEIEDEEASLFAHSCKQGTRALVCFHTSVADLMGFGVPGQGRQLCRCKLGSWTLWPPRRMNTSALKRPGHRSLVRLAG